MLGRSVDLAQELNFEEGKLSKWVQHPLQGSGGLGSLVLEEHHYGAKHNFSASAVTFCEGLFPREIRYWSIEGRTLAFDLYD